MYEFVRTRNGAQEYQHTCAETGVTLTLFRCQMRSKSKWWFLSEADEANPGTDKDVDYYQHRSTAAEEREPQPTGWVSCNGQQAKGKDPPPTLERLDPLCAPGMEEASLEHQLARWVLDNRIVAEVFGPAIHREVVSRAANLLRFLADMRALSPRTSTWPGGPGSGSGRPRRSWWRRSTSPSSRSSAARSTPP